MKIHLQILFLSLTIIAASSIFPIGNRMRSIEHYISQSGYREDLIIKGDKIPFGSKLDLTPKFQEYDNPKILNNQEVLHNIFRHYTIVFVPGFISGLSKLALQKNFKGLMSLFKKHSFKENFHYFFARSNTFQTLEYNSNKLKKLLEGIQAPTILIGHSMGGLIIENTLLKNPHLQEQIKGVLTLQSPFYGSPIADKLLESLPGRLLMKALLSSKGSLDSLKDLQVRSRKLYQEETKQQRQVLINKIPHLNYLAEVDSNNHIFMKYHFHPRASISNLTELFKFMHNSQENDYFVPLQSQYQEDSYFVLDKGDHLSLVMWNQFNNKKEINLKLVRLIQLLTQLIR